MSRVIRSYIVDIVETDDVIYCDKDGHLTYNIEADKNELVRCKDCCHIFDGDCPITWEKTDDDFCSYGERRE